RRHPYLRLAPRRRRQARVARGTGRGATDRTAGGLPGGSSAAESGSESRESRPQVPAGFQPQLTGGIFAELACRDASANENGGKCKEALPCRGTKRRSWSR